jgi:hypothetical protein
MIISIIIISHALFVQSMLTLSNQHMCLLTDEGVISEATLDKTALGFKLLRWNLSIGEQLARHQVPFMPRGVRIASVGDALFASSLMMRLWRTNSLAPTATLKGGATALHLAVEHQVRLKRLACTC